MEVGRFLNYFIGHCLICTTTSCEIYFRREEDKKHQTWEALSLQSSIKPGQNSYQFPLKSFSSSPGEPPRPKSFAEGGDCGEVKEPPLEWGLFCPWTLQSLIFSPVLGAGTFPRLSKDKSPAQRVLLTKTKAVGEGWDSAQSGPHGTATRLSKTSWGWDFPSFYWEKVTQSHLLSSRITLITPAPRSGIKHFYRAEPHLGGKKRALGIGGWKNEIEICRTTPGIGKEEHSSRICFAWHLGWENQQAARSSCSSQRHLNLVIFAGQH